MNNITNIIEKIDLKPLNIFDNSTLKYKYVDEVPTWRCTTKVHDLECEVVVLSLGECVQLDITLNTPCDNTTLKKINEINSKNWGCGICVYALLEINQIVLRTSMLDFGINTEETITKILSQSVESAKHVLKEFQKQ